jgi:hypothetical protein
MHVVRKNLVLAFVLFILLCILAGCTSTGTEPEPSILQKEFYIPAVDEELYGTWVSPENQPPETVPNLIIYPWGLIEGFSSSSEPVWKGTSIIVEKWRDEDGNIWCKELRMWSNEKAYGGKAYVLNRISSGENILETIYSAAGWPSISEMVPEGNPTYTMYRRQE